MPHTTGRCSAAAGLPGPSRLAMLVPIQLPPPPRPPVHHPETFLCTTADSCMRRSPQALLMHCDSLLPHLADREHANVSYPGMNTVEGETPDTDLIFVKQQQFSSHPHGSDGFVFLSEVKNLWPQRS